MNHDQVAQLLGAAAAVDQYAPQPNPTVLSVWTAMLGDIPEQFAAQALVKHYRSNTDTIRPADIVNAWRDHRRHQLDEANRPQPQATPEAIHAGIDQVFAALAHKKALTAGEDPDTALDIAESQAAARRLERSVACPHCDAPTGQPCVNHRGQPLQKTPAHESRLQLAMGKPIDTTPRTSAARARAEVLARAGGGLAGVDGVSVDL